MGTDMGMDMGMENAMGLDVKMAMTQGPPLATWLEAQDVERLNRYREFLDFYEGRQWSGGRQGQRGLSGPGAAAGVGEARLTLNYARVLVRKAVAYLMPVGVTFDVDAPLERDADADPAEQRAARVARDRAERALHAVYAELDLHALDATAALDAAVLGDGAFKVTWDARRQRPRIAPVDPATLWAWWRPDDPSDVWRVAQRYRLTRGEAALLFGLTLGAGDDPQQPVVAVEDWQVERYRVEVDGATVVDAPNPYGWIPYVIFPNVARPHEFWGASDLEDLREVCRELNTRMTTISRILHVSGYPVTVLENVSGSDGIRAEAGAIWELPEDSRAYLLDMLGGGVTLHIDYVNLLYRQLHDLSETPRTAFGDNGRALSGVALEVEIQPLVQKVLRKRRIWDRVYRQRNALVLDLLERFGGLDLGGARSTRAHWGQILPGDREVLARTERGLVSAGVRSRRAAMVALGDTDPDRTWAQVLQEAERLHAAEQGGGDGSAGVARTSLRAVGDADGFGADAEGDAEGGVSAVG